MKRSELLKNVFAQEVSLKAQVDSLVHQRIELKTRIADLELDRDTYMGQHERDQVKIKELEDKCWQYANALYMIGTENCKKPFELARNTRDMLSS